MIKYTFSTPKLAHTGPNKVGSDDDRSFPTQSVNTLVLCIFVSKIGLINFVYKYLFDILTVVNKMLPKCTFSNFRKQKVKTKNRYKGIGPRNNFKLVRIGK